MNYNDDLMNNLIGIIENTNKIESESGCGSVRKEFKE